MLLEGESLLNDASGLTLFEVFFHIVSCWQQQQHTSLQTVPRGGGRCCHSGAAARCVVEVGLDLRVEGPRCAGNRRAGSRADQWSCLLAHVAAAQLHTQMAHPEAHEPVHVIVGHVFLAVVQLGMSECQNFCLGVECCVGATTLLFRCRLFAALMLLPRNRCCACIPPHLPPLPLLLLSVCAVGFVMGMVFGILTRLFLRFMRCGPSHSVS